MAQTPDLSQDLVIPAQAGIGTIQCERTRAMSKHVRFLLLVTNYQIATCQGNAMDTGRRRYDDLKIIPHLNLNNIRRNKLPITKYSSPRRRPGSIAPQGHTIPLPRPPGASTPSPAKGNFHTVGHAPLVIASEARQSMGNRQPA